MSTTARRLLVAEPMLGDPNFERSVILVIEHTPEGALGLVLNRATDLDVSGVLPEWALLVTPPSVLHVGGPVEERSAWCLARVRDPDTQAGFVTIFDDLGLLDLELDPVDLVPTVQAARLYAGYSGWGPGQLDAELAQEAWFVVDAEPDDPFLADTATLWQRILARQRGLLGRLSVFPPHPSLN